MKARATHTLRIDRRLLETIAVNCDLPDLMREIFAHTWAMAFGRMSHDVFMKFCRDLPCILWTPEDLSTRHVNVRVTDDVELRLVCVSRVVWTACQVTGPLLGSDEELLHSCGNNGAPNTARGMCLNPAHLVRANAESRMALKKARTLLRQVGLTEVAVR